MKLDNRPVPVLPQSQQVIGQMRHSLYSLISESPGLHFRELQRRSRLATGQLLYHLNWMVETALLRTTNDGEYLRFYTQVEIGDEERRILELARQKSVRHILLHLLDSGTANPEAIVEKLSLSPSTVTFHLKKLVNEGIVEREAEGRKAFFTVRDPEAVRRILVKYRDSFLDRMVDRFIDMWEE